MSCRLASFLTYGDFLPLRELCQLHTKNGAKLSLSVAEDMLILTACVWSHDCSALLAESLAVGSKLSLNCTLRRDIRSSNRRPGVLAR